MVLIQVGESASDLFNISGANRDFRNSHWKAMIHPDLFQTIPMGLSCFVPFAMEISGNLAADQPENRCKLDTASED